MCDHCHRVFHLHCLHPTLPAVPDGQWRCPPCIREREQLVPYDRNTAPIEDRPYFDFRAIRSQWHDYDMAMTGRLRGMKQTVEALRGSVDLTRTKLSQYKSQEAVTKREWQEATEVNSTKSVEWRCSALASMSQIKVVSAAHRLVPIPFRPAQMQLSPPPPAAL
jgi:hypothetical protein